MLITSDQKRHTLNSNLEPPKINQIELEVVDSHKILGVTIEKNLNWSIYLDELVERVSNKVNQLSRAKHFLNYHTRKLYFHSYIQSIIDYASCLWDYCSTSFLKPLTQIYKRGIRLINSRQHNLTSNEYLNLDILPLDKKLKFNKGVMMHKIVNKKGPKSLIQNCRENLSRNYHTKIDLGQNPKIEIFKNSFQYSGGDLWNNLPLQLRQLKHLYTFKTAYKKYLLES